MKERQAEIAGFIDIPRSKRKAQGLPYLLYPPYANFTETNNRKKEQKVREPFGSRFQLLATWYLIPLHYFIFRERSSPDMLSSWMAVAVI